MSTVNKILEERGNTHGSYDDIVSARATILEVLVLQYRIRHNNRQPPIKLVVMWQDMILKLVRSASNPEHQDNWDDLAGYSIIIQEVMAKENALKEGIVFDDADDEEWRHA